MALRVGGTRISQLSDALLPAGSGQSVMHTGNAPGPPGTGTWRKGNQSVDSDGVLWICTASGSPGTWARVAGGGAEPGSPPEPYSGINADDLEVSRGHILRLAGTGPRRFVLAIADTIEHAAAVGAVASGADIEAGQAIGVYTYGDFPVRFEAGLELTEGQMAWLSRTQRGVATNVPPTEDQPGKELGQILDASPYAADGVAVVAWDRTLPST
ncbi:MAG: hypothetical protein Q8R92_21140 [Deltaproteobacteria bacterium]|nr:hypothetical protein [Deltaproteobacteria bacterium]